MTKIDYDALDAVAEALEGDWVAEGRGLDEGFSHWGTRGTLTRSDRLTLTLRTEPWVAPGTMEVSGYGHSINVGLGRDPGAIARDITRRLIPDAEEGWADSKAAEEAALTRAAGMEATASALEEAGLRRVASSSNHVNLAPREWGSSIAGPTGDWVVLGPGRVDVKLRYLTAAQAVEVARMVAWVWDD